MNMDLVDKLIQKQRDLGYSDTAFARALGVSRSLWTNTRGRVIPIGLKVLSGAARKFPTLSDEVLHEVALYNERSVDAAQAVGA